MTSKKDRPGMFDDVKGPQAMPAPVQASQNVVKLEQPKRRRRAGVQPTTLYLPDEVHERIREIAFYERKKPHDVMLEGIDHVLEVRGHAERATKAKA